jgi:hypothetical protein
MIKYVLTLLKICNITSPSFETVEQYDHTIKIHENPIIYHLSDIVTIKPCLQFHNGWNPLSFSALLGERKLKTAETPLHWMLQGYFTGDDPPTQGKHTMNYGRLLFQFMGAKGTRLACRTIIEATGWKREPPAVKICGANTT